jgi:DNA-directed RNA polymerase subunit F
VASKIIKKAPVVKKLALAVVKNTTANETKKSSAPKVAAKVAEVSPEKSSELMQMQAQDEQRIKENHEKAI